MRTPDERVIIDDNDLKTISILSGQNWKKIWTKKESMNIKSRDRGVLGCYDLFIVADDVFYIYSRDVTILNKVDFGLVAVEKCTDFVENDDLHLLWDYRRNIDQDLGIRNFYSKKKKVEILKCEEEIYNSYPASGHPFIVHHDSGLIFKTEQDGYFFVISYDSIGITLIGCGTDEVSLSKYLSEIEYSLLPL